MLYNKAGSKFIKESNLTFLPRNFTLFLPAFCFTLVAFRYNCQWMTIFFPPAHNRIEKRGILSDYFGHTILPFSCVLISFMNTHLNVLSLNLNNLGSFFHFLLQFLQFISDSLVFILFIEVYYRLIEKAHRYY